MQKILIFLILILFIQSYSFAQNISQCNVISANKQEAQCRIENYSANGNIENKRSLKIASKVLCGVDRSQRENSISDNEATQCSIAKRKSIR